MGKRKYYTLLERTPCELWAPQFGDYDRKVVEQEQRDMKDSGSFVKGTKFTIITTDGSQKAISEHVAELNAEITAKAIKESQR
jgi:hypothetical protein